MDIISEIIEATNQAQITKNNFTKKLKIKLRNRSTSDSKKQLIQTYLDICDNIENLERAYEFNKICLLYIPDQKMKQCNNQIFIRIKTLRFSRDEYLIYYRF